MTTDHLPVRGVGVNLAERAFLDRVGRAFMSIPPDQRRHLDTPAASIIRPLTITQVRLDVLNPAGPCWIAESATYHPQGTEGMT